MAMNASPSRRPKTNGGSSSNHPYLYYVAVTVVLCAISALMSMKALASIQEHNVGDVVQQFSTRRKLAIAYVIGGCKPEDPSYRYYLYDILISIDYMRRENSQADVIVMIQMAYESAYEELTAEDQRMLAAKNVQISYIPKNPHESFYSIMLDKFRVLSLTQYERVVFSDGDVVIRGSLDYLYDLSVAGILKENLVIAGKTEPANGGFFMVRPTEDATKRLRAIIAAKETRALASYPNFDREIGWGHNFTAAMDYFELHHHQRHTLWQFHGDFADQGLLYQWVKYEERSVSIVFPDGIQNWGRGDNGTVRLEATHSLDVMDTLSKRPARECWHIKLKAPCRPPYTDHAHFTGNSKPWLRGPPEDWETSQSPSAQWFQVLHRVNQQVQLGLNFSEWRKGHRPLLGLYPLHVSAKRVNYTDSIG